MYNCSFPRSWFRAFVVDHTERHMKANASRKKITHFLREKFFALFFGHPTIAVNIIVRTGPIKLRDDVVGFEAMLG